MKGTGTPREEDEVLSGSLVDALLVYAEPLASDARVAVIASAGGAIAERLLDLGARRVLLFDPDAARAAIQARSAPRGVTVRALDELRDVRDGELDLVVIADMADVDDPRSTVAWLGRAVAPRGAVVAMGRARLPGEDASEKAPFAAELAPAALDYHELYALFDASFGDVSLAGVVPFEGVVFAQLGAEDESPPVSVDTRLAPPDAPTVFVVIAGQGGDRAAPLDPYAIVQVPTTRGAPHEETTGLEASVAAAQIKADLLAAQLDEARERLAAADGRSSDALARLDRASSERDAALTRAMELEAVLAAAQQTMSTLERRLLEAEQGVLQRDERVAMLSAEVAALRASDAPSLGTDVIDVGEIIGRAERAEVALSQALAELAAREAIAPRIGVEELLLRAERAEAELALNVADLAQVADAHAAETAIYEEQLRDRARFVAALEKELVRREQLVTELVASLEESREGAPGTFEAAAPLSSPPTSARDRRAEAAAAEEIARLRRKLDELASEVARREGELAARAWRITELEAERARAAAAQARSAPEPPPRDGSTELEAELGRARDELDALRQALTQEHAARVAAESGEELARARTELARQSALLEQMRPKQ